MDILVFIGKSYIESSFCEIEAPIDSSHTIRHESSLHIEPQICSSHTSKPDASLSNFEIANNKGDGQFEKEYERERE